MVRALAHHPLCTRRVSANPMPRETYYFRTGCFLCLAGRHYVVLDLLRDRYLRFDRAPFDALAHSITAAGLATCRAPVASNQATRESQTLLATLLDHGLLTGEPRDSNPCPFPQVARPNDTIFCEQHRPGILGSLRYLPSFMRALRSTCASLDTHSISDTVLRVAERKRSLRRPEESMDMNRLQQLMDAFCRLRPFGSRQYVCLFDSLALIEFLAIHRVFPTWVFGVQPEPFAAHCWVQEADVVINDTVDRVSEYVPILSI